jgi:hypothetical protein
MCLDKLLAAVLNPRQSINTMSKRFYEASMASVGLPIYNGC